MFITENASQKKWQTLLKEEFNVTDPEKLAWVSEMATVQEIKESGNLGVNGGQFIPGAAGAPIHPLYATPMNTLGMGDVAAPGLVNGQVPMTQAQFNQQTPGSGDVPVSTLPISLNIALGTIGLELCKVINAKSPWQLMSYMDFPYTGGKLGLANETSFDGIGAGRENKPIYVKIIGDYTDEVVAALKENENYAVIEVESETGKLTGKYRGFTRMDGFLIVEVISCQDTAEADASLRSVVCGDVTVGDVTIKNARPDFVETMSDFMDGFANFADEDSVEPMTRAQNETGTGNSIGLRLFNKWVKVGAYEVTGNVTRQQLQDLPLYGIDAVSKIMEAMQNELTQHINARILERVFRLGVSNAVRLRRAQGVDLNLYIGYAGSASKALNTFGIKTYTDANGVNHLATWGAVKNAESNSSAENTHTRQRRISSRVLAAADLITITGRRGRPEWIVTNAQVAAALEDCSGYVVAPFPNTMSQDGSNSLYQVGTVNGLKVYVDPYMDWNDTRVCVGSKKEVGVVFMPYILADTVQITAEGTMSPKLLLNSRFSIVDCGFYPETMYYTFAIFNDYGII